MSFNKKKSANIKHFKKPRKKFHKMKQNLHSQKKKKIFLKPKPLKQKKTTYIKNHSILKKSIKTKKSKLKVLKRKRMLKNFLVLKSFLKTFCLTKKKSKSLYNFFFYKTRRQNQFSKNLPKKKFYLFNKFLQNNSNTILKEIANKIFGLNKGNSSKMFYKYGFGKNTSLYLIKQSSFDYLLARLKTQNLFSYRLKMTISQNIQKKIKWSIYSGIRHVNKLPVNGQNTHKNRQTQRKLAYSRFSLIRKKKVTFFKKKRKG